MPTPIDRRSFLRLVGAGAGGAALTGCMAPSPGTPLPDERATAPDTPDTPLPRVAGDPAGRVLVVVELGGGLDGLDLAVPYGDPGYARLRPEIGLDPGPLHRLDDEVALHHELSFLHDKVAVIEGVGSTAADLSHFAMAARWYSGDPDGTANPDTGFLGRLCDQLDDGAPATGISLGVGSSPALLATRATTLGLPHTDIGWWLRETEDPNAAQVRTWLESMGGPGGPPAVAAAQRGRTDMFRFVDALGRVPDLDIEAESSLGWQLSTATRIIGADLGVRVIHVVMDGDFDTHDDHRGTFDYLMMDLDRGLQSFFGQLDTIDRRDDVLVATISEFGRRPEQNGNGTDHGTASTMLLAGPVHPGRYGEASSLERLDDDGNLVATSSFGDYYATLAEGWFGLPASEVQPGSTPTFTDSLVS